MRKHRTYATTGICHKYQASHRYGVSPDDGHIVARNM